MLVYWDVETKANISRNEKIPFVELEPQPSSNLLPHDGGNHHTSDYKQYTLPWKFVEVEWQYTPKWTQHYDRAITITIPSFAQLT